MTRVRRVAPSGAFVRGALVAVLLLAAGCGGDGSPTAPSATGTSISVTYPVGSTIFIGNQVQFEATVTLGDGTERLTADATWSSDAPAVATVSSAGLVTAVAAGEATISAETNPGDRGSVRIRVYPEFRGSWTGWWRAADCTASGSPLFTQLCALLKASPDLVGSPLMAALTQDGALVDGTVDLGELAVGDAPRAEPLEVESGEVSIDGTLRLTFSAVMISEAGLELHAEVLSWETRADTPGRMTGQFEVELSLQGDSGSLVLEGSLQEVTRSASVAAGRSEALNLVLGYAFVPRIRDRIAGLNLLAASSSTGTR